jgi:phage FluMu gp28-like protein
MHFQAQMTVRLLHPVPLVEHGKTHEGKAAGYLVIVWANAERLSEAVLWAEEVALNPKNADGKHTKYKGYVEEAEVQVIEKNQVPEEILATAEDVDRPGVYAATALMFFEREKA